MATKKNSSSKDWQAMMEDWFNKLPPLPKNAQLTLVKITPWLCIIFGIIGVLVGLAAFGIFTAFAPIMILGGAATGGSWISFVVYLVATVLLLMAYPGTRAKKMQGWKLLFWSGIASLLGAIVSLNLGSVIFTLIAFYLLYQIKPYYK